MRRDWSLAFVCVSVAFASSVTPAAVLAQAFTYVGEPSLVASPSAPRRYVVRIRVPYGYSRAQVGGLLRRVAVEKQLALRAQALTVFAYRNGESAEGIFSVGTATIAPFGDWARAGTRGPLETRVELTESYFAGDPSRANGAVKRLATERASQTVGISRRFESWGDADIVARLPSGTVISVLETKTEGPYVTRFRIRARVRGRTVEGWVHDTDVK